jgi:hypothetical protein
MGALVGKGNASHLRALCINYGLFVKNVGEQKATLRVKLAA